MVYVILFAKQTAGSPIGGEPVTVEAIKRAFLAIQRSSTANAGVANVLGLGDFVGPSPRITRDAQLLGGSLVNGSAITYASWLMNFPDPSSAASTADQAAFRAAQYNRSRDQLLDNLRREAPSPLGTDTWEASVYGYNPAVNGDLDWWTFGHAASDATYVNTWPVNVSAPNENPIGPNDTNPVQGVDVTPLLPTMPHILPPIPTAAGAINVGMWLLVVAAGAAAGYYYWQASKSHNYQPPYYPRYNPRKRSARRRRS